MSSHKLSTFFICFLFIFLVSALPGQAYSLQNANKQDSSSSIVIKKIIIVGNKRTKEKIILRELSFVEGDTISRTDLANIITQSRNRIFNTTLFITVDIHILDVSENVKEILIHLNERWYIFPIPIFELADRNFNEWWQQRNRDPERINLGINYLHKNMRGHNETLRAKFQLGFTKKFEAFYFIPYINKKQKIGLNFDISYIINKQIPYKTSNHKLTYFEGEGYIRHKFRTGLQFTYRKRFYQWHSAGISFNYNTIADTIAKLNPNYLLHSHTTQRYFSIRYTFVNDLRDITIYPLKGSYLKLDVEKLGTGIFHEINQLNLNGEYSLFRTLSKKLYFAAGIKQKISFPIHQAYLTVRGLGYEKDYVSGYELYVIDGQHFSLAKLNLKWKLFSTNKHIEALPVDQFETIPFSIYFKIYSDGGYVIDQSYNPENTRLSNKFLLGGGAGIDFVSYYNFVLRLEYSINKIGNQGIFIHLRSAI